MTTETIETGYDAAIEFANSADEPAVTEAEAKPETAEPEKPVEEKPAEAAAPEPEKTPEVLLAEAKEERRQAEEKLAKVNKQFEAHERTKRKLEERESKLIERAKELDGIDSVSAMVAFVSKRRGVPATDIWKELVEEIQNDGKPSEATLARRERDALKRQQAEEQARREQSEAERLENVAQAWGDEMESTLKADAFRQSFPRLAALPQRFLVDTVVQNVEAYRRQTGNFPDHAELLKFLESEIPEPPQSPPAATSDTKPKEKKPTIPISVDAASPAGKRVLSEDDRFELAAQYASGLGD